MSKRGTGGNDSEGSDDEEQSQKRTFLRSFHGRVRPYEIVFMIFIFAKVVFYLRWYILVYKNIKGMIRFSFLW